MVKLLLSVKVMIYQNMVNWLNSIPWAKRESHLQSFIYGYMHSYVYMEWQMIKQNNFFQVQRRYQLWENWKLTNTIRDCYTIYLFTSSFWILSLFYWHQALHQVHYLTLLGSNLYLLWCEQWMFLFLGLVAELFLVVQLYLIVWSIILSCLIIFKCSIYYTWSFDRFWLYNPLFFVIWFFLISLTGCPSQVLSPSEIEAIQDVIHFCNLSPQ